uniref:Viral helicase n=1 Tax=Gengado virus TaxID=2689362 RepID=A0A6B9KGK7_9VIRU|nr:viral helicase [Gengado virus]
MAFLRHSKLLIIDEVYKLPPGYLDLAIFLDPSITSVIILGDPLQSDYHSVNPNSTLSHLLPESVYLRPYFDLYCAYTYRLDQNTARRLGIPSFSKEIGSEARYLPRLPKNSVLLTSMIQTANNFCANGSRAQTAASSQGLTFNSKVGIYLDKSLLLLNLQTALVAVTRSRRGLFFHGDPKLLHCLPPSCEPIALALGITSGNILNSFQHELSHFNRIIQHPNEIPKPILRGLGSSGSKPEPEDVLIDHRQPLRISAPSIRAPIDDHFVPETKRTLLNHFEPTLFSTVGISDDSFVPAPAEPVYPGCDYACLQYELLRHSAPEDSEKLGPSGLSNQFPYINKPFEEECSYPGLIAPIHDIKNDPDLLKMSIEKRLRFRKTSTNVLSPTDQFAGELLYHSYCNAYNMSPVPVPFDEELFMECILDNDYHQLTSKTKSAIIANASRSDPSWKHTVVRIFAKTQHKINLNSVFTDWKACQTLALMHDIVILLLGPVKKYQREMLRRHNRRPTIFVYGGKSAFDMSAFAQQHFAPNATRVANDYTAFDQSQGPESVHFEVLKMRRVGIPESLISFHREIKENISCQFGFLTAMRFTGEPGTYDDNTDFNLALINLEYILGDTPCLISGDDSLLSHEPPTRTSWAHNSHLFSRVQWKKQLSKYGEFCGYYVSSFGAVRAPLPLLAKLGLSKARGELDLTLPSYLAEFSVGHSLGDDLWQSLPVDQVLYQSAVFDFFCRHASPYLKVALRIGSAPDSFLLKSGSPLNYQAFCMLSHASRREYMRQKPHNSAVSWSSQNLIAESL